jgi:hypothetical protein
MRTLCGVFCVVALVPGTVLGQATNVALLKNWPAPLYWQPSPAEANAAAFKVGRAVPQAEAPLNPLVFVGMTPCRVVDTRSGQGFTGAFGPPSLVGGANPARTFPMQLSATCAIPATAQAYSFNIAVVPQGALYYLTIYPTGQSLPLAATLNDSQGVILDNAAIVPAGSPNGGVDVYVTNDTDVIIDVNGYYAPLSGITLAQGTAGAPSLSFAGDAGTGIFSSAAQTLNFATGGTSWLTVLPTGDLDVPGSMRKNGALFLHNLGSFNTGVGLGALAVNTGTLNAALGNSALQANTIGRQNTASGAYALAINTTGEFNTASGAFALWQNTNGTDNTACGAQALGHNTTGNSNTASGSGALYVNTVGAANTASGYYSLHDNQTGNYNTATGINALELSSGDSNTADGAYALHNTTGSNNTALGHSAGFLLATGSNNIIIGNFGVAADDHTIRIGDVQTNTFIAGISGVSISGATVLIDSSGHLGTPVSSRRYKEDIQGMGDASSNLLRLRPVTYRYKQPYADGSKPLDYGLIAEEVAEVYPDLVIRGKDGQVETVQYHKLTPMLLNELQKQHVESEKHTQQQDETIRQLQARLAVLEALLSSKVPATATAGQ